MKKRIIIVLGILIAAGGIGTGVWYHFKGNGQSGTGDSIVYVSKVSVITGSENNSGKIGLPVMVRTAENCKRKNRKWRKVKRSGS